MRDNNLGTSGITTLAQKLQIAQSTSITELSFSNNNIDCEAAADIAQALCCTTQL